MNNFRQKDFLLMQIDATQTTNGKKTPNTKRNNQRAGLTFSQIYGEKM